MLIAATTTPSISTYASSVTPPAFTLSSQVLDSRAVTATFDSGRELRAFEASLRRLRPAVIGRIGAGRLWLDLRGAEPLDELVATLGALS